MRTYMVPCILLRGEPLRLHLLFLYSSTSQLPLCAVITQGAGTHMGSSLSDQNLWEHGLETCTFTLSHCTWPEDIIISIHMAKNSLLVQTVISLGIQTAMQNDFFFEGPRLLVSVY